MDNLKEVFTYDTDKEEYVKELQTTLDKLEELVFKAGSDPDGSYPVWEYLSEKSPDTLAYTILNLIYSKDSIKDKTYKKINDIIG